jgi:hypothetical protein
MPGRGTGRGGKRASVAQRSVDLTDRGERLSVLVRLSAADGDASGSSNLAIHAGGLLVHRVSRRGRSGRWGGVVPVQRHGVEEGAHGSKLRNGVRGRLPGGNGSRGVLGKVLLRKVLLVEILLGKELVGKLVVALGCRGETLVVGNVRRVQVGVLVNRSESGSSQVVISVTVVGVHFSGGNVIVAVGSLGTAKRNRTAKVHTISLVAVRLVLLTGTNELTGCRGVVSRRVGRVIEGAVLGVLLLLLGHAVLVVVVVRVCVVGRGNDVARRVLIVRVTTLRLNRVRSDGSDGRGTIGVVDTTSAVASKVLANHLGLRTAVGVERVLNSKAAARAVGRVHTTKVVAQVVGRVHTASSRGTSESSTSAGAGASRGRSTIVATSSLFAVGGEGSHVIVHLGPSVTLVVVASFGLLPEVHDKSGGGSDTEKHGNDDSSNSATGH